MGLSRISPQHCGRCRPGSSSGGRSGRGRGLCSLTSCIRANIWQNVEEIEILQTVRWSSPCACNWSFFFFKTFWRCCQSSTILLNLFLSVYSSVIFSTFPDSYRHHSSLGDFSSAEEETLSPSGVRSPSPPSTPRITHKPTLCLCGSFVIWTLRGNGIIRCVASYVSCSSLGVMFSAAAWCRPITGVLGSPVPTRTRSSILGVHACFRVPLAGPLRHRGVPLGGPIHLASPDK